MVDLRVAAVLFLSGLFGVFTCSAQVAKPDPNVQKIVAAVSAQGISDTMKELESLGTRGDFTDHNLPDTGIGAARRWIHDQMKSFSPRLEVSFDPWKVKKQGRIFRDVEVVNVVAVLPGT